MCVFCLSVSVEVEYTFVVDFTFIVLNSVMHTVTQLLSWNFSECKGTSLICFFFILIHCLVNAKGISFA